MQCEHPRLCSLLERLFRAFIQRFLGWLLQSPPLAWELWDFLLL